MEAVHPLRIILFGSAARGEMGADSDLDVLVVMPDGFLNVYRAEIVALAARHRLPAIYPWRFFPDIGGLLSYGSDQRELFRSAAAYVDRILKGAKPSDLPVQAPVKYELIINLKTAKALDIEVPLFFQQRADEVIE